MTTKLLLTALVALSVSNLEAALAADIYTPEELAEALGLEKEGQNRKTAIEALEAAIEGPVKTEEPVKAPKGFKVPKGKALVTNAGIKAEGEIITAEMVTGGTARLNLLKQKGLLV